ncbi:MAG: aldo/keto reductase [Maledivibacter sp.]|jgi:aryl-alcohol dehydrogenase-like predicted oxidoreductase|nr:aldo/keto reductase [Maledivibacter sp.]
MKNRKLGKAGVTVSEIGLGTWQLGSKWGEPFNHDEAMNILSAAKKNGINFIDTADVYNNGNSEKVIGEFMKKDIQKPFVVTKCGRQLNPHTAEMYTPEAVEKYVEESIQRMDVENLDMILLHCPPTTVYKKSDVFAKLDELKKVGKIKHYGVSVEKVEEAIEAMNYDISAIEIIFNMFRLKPAEKLFDLAKEKNIGIIVRVPLASGLLTGKFNKTTSFGESDHRSFNRNGEHFDKGETFSGVDYDLGLEAVQELKKVFGTENLVPYALKWILMHDAVSVVIPGASKTSQVESNIKASELPALSKKQMNEVKAIYDKYIKESVHNNW